MNLTTISFESLGLILFTTIFLSMLLVPVTSALARRIGAIDIPKSRSSHARPIPRMGGLAMSLSLAMACLAYLPANAFLLAFLSGLFAIVVTGVIDDTFEISPRWKFAGQIVAATLFVSLSGMQIEHIGDIVGLGDIELGRAAPAFTVFCLVGAMNAFNLVDGLDGLASGISVIAAVFLGYFALSAHAGELMIIDVSLIGAIIGFLRYNSYPARVFMGDSGSLMLGYVVTVLLISLSHSASNVPIAALAMVVALPLLDTLLVMGRRIHFGRSPFDPDRTHLHHRLIELGWSHPTVVVMIYGVMLAFGFLAIMLQGHPRWVIFSSLVGLGSWVFAAVALAQKAGFRNRVRSAKRLEAIRHTHAFRRVSEVLTATAQPIGTAVIAGLLLPALFAPLLALSWKKVVMLCCIAALLVFFTLRHRANKNIMHGVLYLAIFALMLVYNLSGLAYPSWLETYISALSVIVLMWVLLKMVFAEHGEVIFASELELLLLFISWFIPFVVLKELHISPGVLRAVQKACLLSIPFLLAMKINIRNLEGNDRWVTIPLIVALVVVAARTGW